MTCTGPCKVINANEMEFNPYSWNAHANIFFIDQPIGVGFSYADYGETVVRVYHFFLLITPRTISCRVRPKKQPKTRRLSSPYSSSILFPSRAEHSTWLGRAMLCVYAAYMSIVFNIIAGIGTIPSGVCFSGV